MGMLLLTEKEAAAWLPVVTESVAEMVCGCPRLLALTCETE